MNDDRPNILLITCDQLRLDALGCYGNPVIHTPHIDALAARGVRFNRAFTAAPICAPNRGSIVTGRYPSVHGLRENGMVLRPSELTLMEMLRRAGYRTCGAGKMHFGPQWRMPVDGGALIDPSPDMAIDPQPAPAQMPWYGFEEVCLTEDNRVGPYERYLREHGHDVWADPHSFTYPQHITVRSAYPDQHYQTTWIADRAIKMLERRCGDRPFFVWASFVDPHHPFTPPAPFDTMYDPADMPLPAFDPNEVDRWPSVYGHKHFACEGSHEAIGMCDLSDADWQRVIAYYYGMVSLIDKQVGRLVEVLARTGEFDRTIILFTADHGEMLGDHHLMFKGTNFDCVTNVPLIVTRPGERCGGESREAMCSSIDLTPTVLDMLGLAVPSSVQGRSLAPNLDDAAAGLRQSILIEHQTLMRGLRTDRELLVWHGPGERGEFYDLTDDPHCFRNRWAEPSWADRRWELTDVLFEQIVLNRDPAIKKLGPC